LQAAAVRAKTDTIDGVAPALPGGAHPETGGFHEHDRMVVPSGNRQEPSVPGKTEALDGIVMDGQVGEDPLIGAVDHDERAGVAASG
jgi:hypothetical protein